MSAPKHSISDEIRYRLLKLLSENPEITQRDLAIALGISLGKANYSVRTLIDRGWIKVVNSRNNRQKVGFLYQLTPKGVIEKTHTTRCFLQNKLAEFRKIENEIVVIMQEMGMSDVNGSTQFNK